MTGAIYTCIIWPRFSVFGKRVYSLFPESTVFEYLLGVIAIIITGSPRRRLLVQPFVWFHSNDIMLLPDGSSAEGKEVFVIQKPETLLRAPLI